MKGVAMKKYLRKAVALSMAPPPVLYRLRPSPSRPRRRAPQAYSHGETQDVTFDDVKLDMKKGDPSPRRC